MSIITSPMLLGADVGGAYQVSRSLRFNSPDSAYLSRVVSSAGNRKTFTLSWWTKRSGLTTFQSLFNSYTDGNNRAAINFDSAIGAGGSGDYLTMFNVSGGTTTSIFQTNALFRDVSAWYHIVISVDTTQAISTDRVRLWVNSVIQTFSTYNAPSQNADLHWNSAATHYFGVYGGSPGTTSYGFNGYLADINFIDGLALDPSSFATTDATTGQWIPKAYSGSYGTNGFKLTFADNSNNTASTLGKDTSGNGNNFSPSNFSVTAGSGNDSLVDTPTSYGTDTGAGGEVRGNYATLNPLAAGVTVVNGNLDFTYTSTNCSVLGTVGMRSGKYRWEFTPNVLNSNWDLYAGVIKTTSAFNKNNNECRYNANAYSIGNMYGGSASIRPVNNNTFGTSFGWTWTNGDTLGLYFDATNGTLKANQNGGTLVTVYTGLPTDVDWLPLFSDGSVSSATHVTNFGQRSFAYSSAESGFKALCDTNLPSPLIAKPSTVMDVVLRTGTGASGGTISSLNFSADFIWSKLRSASSSHYLLDSVRGIANTLQSNSTASETSYPTWFTSVTSTGYTVGSGDWSSGSSVVEWCWDAGTSTVTNTQGSITSSVRANPSAGFSVITWTGNSTDNATIGHGLGVTPQFVITKRRDSTSYWLVYHVSLGKDKYIWLNDTSAAGSLANYWGSTGPTSTTIQLSQYQNNTGSMVAYAFAPATGYSSFGSYTGNGSSDGPFVYTGFRPRFMLVKAASGTDVSTDGYWNIADIARAPYNWVGPRLAAQSSAAEDLGSTQWLDILSNGFKMRNGGTSNNNSGTVYIYAAFAENPFQYARAR